MSAAEVQAELDAATQAVVDADIDETQAKVDLAVGVAVAATAPISAPVAAVSAALGTATELTSAGVDFSQGQTMDGALRVGGAVAGPVVSKGIRAVGKAFQAADDLAEAGQTAVRSTEELARVGRSGKQTRLRELADDPNASSADRGWIRQEMNSIERGQRQTIRVPPGKVLAHRRGFKAQDGFSYHYSDLQDVSLHKLQHKFEGY